MLATGLTCSVCAANHTKSKDSTKCDPTPPAKTTRFSKLDNKKNTLRRDGTEN
jgi:hypothetical protein